MITMMIELLLCASDVLVFSYFCYIFLSRRKNRSLYKSLILSVFLTFILYILTTKQYGDFNTDLSALIVICITYSYLYGFSLMNICKMIMVYFLMGFVTVLVLNIALLLPSVDQQTLFSDPLPRISIALITRSILILIFFLLHKRNIKKFNGNHIINVILVLIFSLNIIITSVIYIITLFINKDELNIVIIFGLVTTFLNLLLILGIYQYLIKVVLEKEKLSQENQWLMISKINNTIIEDKTKKLNKIKHDFKFFFNTIDYLINTGQKEEIKKYFDDKKNEINQMLEGSNSGNTVIDSSINYFINRYPDIVFKKRIYVNDQLKSVNMLDLCSLLGNTISNAVEACLNTDLERVISIEIRVKESNIVIRISNTFNNEEHKAKKINPHLHGFGTGNIQDIVKKYDGILNQYTEDDLYHVDILLKT